MRVAAAGCIVTLLGLAFVLAAIYVALAAANVVPTRPGVFELGGATKFWRGTTCCL